MLLAIDIGNTGISLGLFKERRLIKKAVVPTASGSYLGSIKKIIARNQIDNVIICSVVPGITQGVMKDAQKILSIRPKIVGRDVRVPVKNLYRNPKQGKRNYRKK